MFIFASRGPRASRGSRMGNGAAGSVSRVLPPPMFGKNALHVRDATLRGHPLLGVEPVLVRGLLGFVNRRRTSERGDQWFEGKGVEQRAGRPAHQQRVGGDAWREAAQVKVRQRPPYGLGPRRVQAKIVVDLLERIRRRLRRELRRLVEERRR